MTLGIGVINSRADDRVKIGRTEVSIGAPTRIAEILTHAEHFQEKSAALLGGRFLGQYHTKLIVPRVRKDLPRGCKECCKGFESICTINTQIEHIKISGILF